MIDPLKSAVLWLSMLGQFDRLRVMVLKALGSWFRGCWFKRRLCGIDPFAGGDECARVCLISPVVGMHVFHVMSPCRCAST